MKVFQMAFRFPEMGILQPSLCISPARGHYLNFEVYDKSRPVISPALRRACFVSSPVDRWGW